MNGLASFFQQCQARMHRNQVIPSMLRRCAGISRRRVPAPGACGYGRRRDRLAGMVPGPGPAARSSGAVQLVPCHAARRCREAAAGTSAATRCRISADAVAARSGWWRRALPPHS